ncbi:MAG: rRNA adenine dimethyltransferase family protein, partial [Phycisphaerales bacterium]|nr:rRNA adenine dimethyltransferase family protein [Phycisphaerales bacterium]
GDAARVDYANIVATPWLLVGNLPYNAANAIIMHALESSTPPVRMVVMVQKEVGERLLGLPGCRGLLTVAVQLWADVERVCTVKPGAFVPPPKVDSMVVRITPKPRLSTGTRFVTQTRFAEEVIRVAKAGFANRRKQLHGNLAEAGVASSDVTKRTLVALGLPPTARAEELSIEEWMQFTASLRA